MRHETKNTTNKLKKITMKKQLLSIALGLVAMFTVSTSFAADAKSSKSNEAIVKVDGNKTNVFNQKGKFVYSIQRFTSDALPKDILDIVKRSYDQYYISGMEKIDQRGIAPIYIVHLIGTKTIKTVQVNTSDNEVSLVNDYIKG